MSRILFDIKHSVRRFVRAPGLALALLLTIALGIGSNASVHGFARGLTRPEFLYRSSDRLVSIFALSANGGADPVSYNEYLLLKHHSDGFEWIGAARIAPATMVMANQSVIASVAAVTPNLARMLELPIGNGAAISHHMWRDEFDSSANIRGKQIRIDGMDTRVNGVAPKWLEGLYRNRSIDIWVALQPKSQSNMDDGGKDLWVVARLRRNVSAAQAQNSLRRSRSALAQIRVLPYTGMTPDMAEGMADVGSLLDFAADAVFLIACVNVASFLLGRAFNRSQETALRVAFGANRTRLTIEVLWDSIVISIAGGLCAVLLSVWTARVIPAFLFEQDAKRLLLRPNLLGVVAASGICVVVTILCGLIPFFLKPDSSPAAVLRRESAGPSRAMRRLRESLIVIQMTSCCTLVVLTAFLFNGLQSALQTKSGQRLKNAILITTQSQPYIQDSYFRQVEEVTRSTGVLPLAWAARLPGNQAVWQSFRVEPRQASYHEILLHVSWFTTESLQKFAPAPIAGRLFGLGNRMCRVAIVNVQAAAEMIGKNTVGRVIRDSTGLPIKIIGIVAEKPRNDGQASLPTIYYDAAGQTKPEPDRITLARFRAPTASRLARVDLNMNVVSPSYFKAMGFPLTDGSGFTGRRMPGECRVAVVNQEAANLYFGGKSAIGAAVIDDRGTRTAIIGIVHSRPFGIFQRRSEPAIYFPMSQDCPRYMTLIGVSSKPKGLDLPNLRHTVESVPGRNPTAAVTVDTLSSQLARTALAPLHITTLVFGASAATGILLSILGLFGVLSDVAHHRRREWTIRAALGAQPWRILVQMLQEGGRLACVGAVAGTLGALTLSRLLARIIPGNASPGLLAWLVAPVILGAIVLIAGLPPAMRAMAVNPLSIMRDE